jgi:uncharacterized repeat protein (TIGR03803 family)
MLAGCGGSQPSIGAPSAASHVSAFGAGSNSTNYQVVYSFSPPPDGVDPTSSLLDVNGTLYGTTALGGSSSCGGLHCGTVFSVTTSGKETVLHSFTGGSADGASPHAALVNVDGALYGTTQQGGSSSSCGSGCGTVFSITTSGKETVLYSFKGGKTDGQNPYAGLIYVKDRLYGTTAGGGAYCLSSGGCGTVFATTPAGAETVLHSFGHDDDGAGPRAGLLDINGALYGTTLDGGKYAYNYYPGTVFEILTSGKERVLHSFNGDGDEPAAALINVKGTLYGTTEAGGAGYCYSSDDSGCGTIFALQL